jgi:hypothetical protein
MPVLLTRGRSTRRSSPVSKIDIDKIDIDDFIETKLKGYTEPNNETNKTKMSNSMMIYNIAKEIANPDTKCPTSITLDMLIQELDCEDLRSRVKKEPGSVKKEELWAAYVNINMHIFSKYTPPRQHHKSIATLMPTK